MNYNRNALIGINIILTLIFSVSTFSLFQPAILPPTSSTSYPLTPLPQSTDTLRPALAPTNISNSSQFGFQQHENTESHPTSSSIFSTAENTSLTEQKKPLPERSFPYNPSFEALYKKSTLCELEITEWEISLLLFDLEKKETLATLNSKKQMPVASAFKVGVLLYALDNLDNDIWNNIPAKYWSQEGNIPNDVLLHLKENWILSRLYDMVVHSSNGSTAQVLSFINKNSQTSLNPVEQYNLWSYEVVGISEASGLYAWQNPPILNEVDSALANRFVEGRCGGNFYFFNTYSAQDLALYYIWLIEEAPQDIKNKAFELLRINEGPPGAIKTLATDLEGTAYNKSGQFGEKYISYVWVDAGIIETRSDKGYLIVTSSWNAETLLPNFYALISEIIKHREGLSLQQGSSTNLDSRKFIAP